jgi:hypothetical protein
MIHPAVTTLALAACLAVILRLRVRPAVLWSIAVLLAGLAIGHLAVTYQHPQFNLDYCIFRDVGKEVWMGHDPYASEQFFNHPFLNPPTALPLFALFAVPSPRVSCALWSLANLLICFALVFLAHQVLRQDPSTARPRPGTASNKEDLSCAALAVLTAALLASDATILNFYIGQLGVLAALVLLLALLAQAWNRPAWAGFWLALGTVKVGTMLPFLLLFHRKTDRRVWVFLSATVAFLCLLTIPLPEMPGRLSSLLHHIGELSAPGQVNDYSFQGTQHLNLIGFDHALYCLGFRDRSLIGILQYVILLPLSGWVAWCVLGPRRLSRGAAWSLVALFSMLFLYHRLYDAVVLVLPLVYCTRKARTTEGKAQWLYTVSASALLAVLFLNRYYLADAFDFAQGESGFLGWLVQAVVLPIATWLLLLAAFTLTAAERRVHSLPNLAKSQPFPRAGSKKGRASPGYGAARPSSDRLILSPAPPRP